MPLTLTGSPKLADKQRKKKQFEKQKHINTHKTENNKGPKDNNQLQKQIILHGGSINKHRNKTHNQQEKT